MKHSVVFVWPVGEREMTGIWICVLLLRTFVKRDLNYIWWQSHESHISWPHSDPFFCSHLGPLATHILINTWWISELGIVEWTSVQGGMLEQWASRPSQNKGLPNTQPKTKRWIKNTTPNDHVRPPHPHPHPPCHLSTATFASWSLSLYLEQWVHSCI